MWIAEIDTREFEALADAFPMLFIFGVLLCALGVAFFFLIGWWITNRPGSRSPFTKQPMYKGDTLEYDAVTKVYSFQEQLSQDTNPFFDLNTAAICRQTGRIFPHSLSRFGIIRLSRNVYEQAHPGNYVSWGSLHEKEQEAILQEHGPVDGFQFINSSSNPYPDPSDMPYACMKPGPLFVDPETKVLVGWRCIPGTDLEFLVVQRPLTWT